MQHALLAQKIKGLHEELNNIERERSDRRMESTDGDAVMRDLEGEREKLDQQLNSLEKMYERLENEKVKTRTRRGCAGGG